MVKYYYDYYKIISIEEKKIENATSDATYMLDNLIKTLLYIINIILSKALAD